MVESVLEPIVRSPRRATTGEVVHGRVEAWRREGLCVAFVPTMGALHEGHLSLVRRARQHADRVVASIFVNPTQFGPGEDFESYPRSVDQDCRKLGAEGCDLVFLPTAGEIYPPGASTFVDVEGPATGFEAVERPGHFRGVATVVLALFGLVRPQVAVFGQKDAQQLAVIRQMVRDLHLPIEIIAAPIVREADGLAMSSRNVYLDPEQRRAARVLCRALAGARRLIEAGEREAEKVREHLAAALAAEPAARTDYIGVVEADTFRPLETLRGRVVIPIAVRFGDTRLLDNLLIDLDQLPVSKTPR